MEKLAILLGACVLSLVGCSERSSQKPAVVWRTDAAPVSQKLPLISSSEACIWHGGKATDFGQGGLPAPSDYFIAGYIALPHAEVQRLLREYQWTSVTLDKGLLQTPPDSAIVTKFVSSGDHLESSDFMRAHTKVSSYADGKVVLSPEANVLFFYLRTL